MIAQEENDGVAAMSIRLQTLDHLTYEDVADQHGVELVGDHLTHFRNIRIVRRHGYIVRVDKGVFWVSSMPRES